MKNERIYKNNKRKILQEAKKFLKYKNKNNLAWFDYYDYLEYLMNRAKRYGLLREFKKMKIE